MGGADELFYPDRFAPLFEPVRPDMRITIVPGIGQHRDDRSAGGHRRRAKIFLGPHGARDRLNSHRTHVRHGSVTTDALSTRADQCPLLLQQMG